MRFIKGLFRSFGQTMKNKTVKTLALGGALTLGIGSQLMAVPEAIPYTPIEFDWASFATNVTGQFAGVLAVGFSIGLALWAAMLLYRKFKTSAR